MVFLSHNEESNVHLKIAVNRGGHRPPQNFLQGRARGPPPPPPGWGGGGGGWRVNQSCLTADMWFHSVIRYLPCQKGQSTATGCAILSQVAQGGAVARKVNVYTRHIRNTKGQRSGHGVYTTQVCIPRVLRDVYGFFLNVYYYNLHTDLCKMNSL